LIVELLFEIRRRFLNRTLGKNNRCLNFFSMRCWSRSHVEPKPEFLKKYVSFKFAPSIAYISVASYMAYNLLCFNAGFFYQLFLFQHSIRQRFPSFSVHIFFLPFFNYTRGKLAAHYYIVCMHTSHVLNMPVELFPHQ
jgi:hypothetical protein